MDKEQFTALNSMLCEISDVIKNGFEALINTQRDIRDTLDAIYQDVDDYINPCQCEMCLDGSTDNCIGDSNE